MKELVIGIVTILIITMFSVVGKGVSIYNTHIDLKTQIEAQQKDNEANFDNMWNKIKQATQMSDKYKDNLKEVILAYTEGRKKDSRKLLMDWTKEAIPTVDSSIYKQLNNIIVGSRDDLI